jgi:hypothetical protein
MEAFSIQDMKVVDAELLVVHQGKTNQLQVEKMFQDQVHIINFQILVQK